jgi:4-carboxymuconolactone decarboxylase
MVGPEDPLAEVLMGDEPEVAYLPEIYEELRDRYPEVARALDELGHAADQAGPLDSKTQRLATLGIAIGAVSKGAVRSNVRKALGVGATPDEIRQVALLAVTTRGFPGAVAGFQWIEEVLREEA